MTSASAVQRNRRPIYALIAGDFVSQFGNAITTIALPWFVLETTGSASLTGIVFVMLFLPAPIVTFCFGAMVDRVRRTRLSIAADVLSGVSIGLIPALHYLDQLNYVLLLGLVLTGAVLDGPGFSARRSLVPSLAERGGLSLGRANSAFQVNWSASVLIGPAIGGGLVALIGATAAMWVDAGSFLVSALLVGLFVPEVRQAEDEADTTAPNGARDYLREIWEGVQWIRADRVLSQVLLSASITMTLIAALMVLIMPVYADVVFEDPVSLGIMVAGFGLGSLVGSLGFGYLADKVDGRRVYLVSTALTGLPFILLALEPSIFVATALGALIGLAFSPIIPSMDTIIQERTDESIRGRVFSTRFALNNLVKLPGLLVIGLALDGSGVAPTLIGLGALAMILAGYLAIRHDSGMARHGDAGQSQIGGGKSSAAA